MIGGCCRLSRTAARAECDAIHAVPGPVWPGLPTMLNG